MFSLAIGNETFILGVNPGVFYLKILNVEQSAGYPPEQLEVLVWPRSNQILT